MKDQMLNPIDIIKNALNAFGHRLSSAPDMFESLTPLCKRLGYESVGVYIADEYPDRMTLTAGYGAKDAFPRHVALRRRNAPVDEARRLLRNVPNLMLGRLFNQDCELGVMAVSGGEAPGPEDKEAFDILVGAVSVMAYVERLRTSISRERQERELFFAHSLANRLVRQDLPEVQSFRLGCECVRSLEAGGDFYDLVPEPNGGLLGVIGSCSGKGLRTVMEMTSILRETFRSFPCAENLSDALRRINTMLVEERRRAHQASLCLFRVDAKRRRLRLAKSGRLGVLLCRPDGGIENLSGAGATFLGMVPRPDIHDDEYDFSPGQAFFCITEGFYWSSLYAGNGNRDDHFIRLVRSAFEAKREKPLVNVLFDALGREKIDLSLDNSVLALSVEFTGGKREDAQIGN